jgi:hypothetical protein
MSTEERGRSSYMDLLITTLTKHEKNLDSLSERLEKVHEDLSAIYKEAGSKTRKKIATNEKGKTSSSDADTLIYLKIGADRPLDEIVKIIESLKKR